MKTQRFVIALTIVNFVVLLAVLLQGRPTFAQSAAPVLRGKGLEIVDDQGRVRASISVLPGHPVANAGAFPDTVILRLIDMRGKPTVKLAASELGSVLGLLGDSEQTYSRIESTGTNSLVTLENKGGTEHVIKPQGYELPIRTPVPKTSRPPSPT